MKQIVALQKLLLSKPLSIALLVGLTSLLPGCVTDGIGTVSKLSPICGAVIGPIKYTTHNVKDRRFAGVDLAPDLAERNRVGVNLGCPAYR